MRLMTGVLTVGILSSAVAVGGPPPAPEGYVWVPNAKFTDEFNGDRLDASKWHDHHPRWKGRPPARFVPANVSVKDGLLRLRNSVLEPADGKFTIAGAAVVSKSTEAFYGYYEVRMKASKISMSSTFWMSNPTKTEADGSRTSLEIDIQEAVGRGKRQPKRRHFMKSNTHYFRSKGGEKTNRSTPGDCPISPPADEAFHVYGAWWVDANTVRFYHNGDHKFTLRPSTEFSETPFDRAMHLNMVTETYDWETPPTPAELADESRTTTCYDWVRAYTLVREGPNGR